MSAVGLSKPRLAPGVRIRWDGVRHRSVLLFPEGALALNSTAAEVLELCDGRRTVDDIAAELAVRYGAASVHEDVAELLSAIAAQGLVIDDDT